MSVLSLLLQKIASELAKSLWLAAKHSPGQTSTSQAVIQQKLQIIDAIQLIFTMLQ